MSVIGIVLSLFLFGLLPVILFINKAKDELDNIRDELEIVRPLNDDPDCNAEEFLSALNILLKFDTIYCFIFVFILVHQIINIKTGFTSINKRVDKICCFVYFFYNPLFLLGCLFTTMIKIAFTRDLNNERLCLPKEDEFENLEISFLKVIVGESIFISLFLPVIMLLWYILQVKINPYKIEDDIDEKEDWPKHFKVNSKY